ncbi:hypothetical protein LIA77_00508 [Sarocladium implicatum]|nr:hypothetical protein LIA77_00508 [Sarocladium implicatum]
MTGELIENATQLRDRHQSHGGREYRGGETNAGKIAGCGGGGGGGGAYKYSNTRMGRATRAEKRGETLLKCPPRRSLTTRKITECRGEKRGSQDVTDFSAAPYERATDSGDYRIELQESVFVSRHLRVGKS